MMRMISLTTGGVLPAWTQPGGRSITHALHFGTAPGSAGQTRPYPCKARSVSLSATEGLAASSAPKAPSRVPSGRKCFCSILCGHCDRGLDVRQAASCGSCEHSGGGGLLVGELANHEPVVTAEGQVPGDEPPADRLE